MVGIETAIDRIAADLGQLGRIPTVAAQQRHLDAQLPRLNRNVADIGVVARNENHIRLARANRG